MKKFPNLGRFFSKISEPWKIFQQNFRTSEKFPTKFPNLGKNSAFTLIELLAVIAIIILLVSILLPMISAAYATGERATCISNLRQLWSANTSYAAEHGTYVAAAQDIHNGNRMRWHGVRSGRRGEFDAAKGPLTPYLGGENRIRSCPSFKDFREDRRANAFESSCGGYGYNSQGVGSQVYVKGDTQEGVEYGMPPSSIKHPAKTVMFCDAALAQPYTHPEYLIEYSFAEAYRHLDGSMARPSIHFRHSGRANVVWCDGHVSAEPMNPDLKTESIALNIGWFGEADNTLFDPH